MSRNRILKSASELLTQTDNGAADKKRRTNNGLPEIVDAFDLSRDETPPPPVLVDGFIHQETKVVVGGGSKSFKTWLLMDLAISVSHGVEWLGRQTEQAPVLFLNFEIQQPFVRQRINQVAAAKGVDFGNGKLCFWNLRGHAKSYHEILPELSTEVEEASHGLIVLDPLYKLMGDADENSARDITLLLNEVERMATRTGAAIAFGSHFSKGSQSGKEAIDRISGSGVFARDPDSIITLTAHEADFAYTVDATLRNLPPVEPFVVEWDFPLFTVSDLDPSRLKKRANQATYSPEDVLGQLEDGMTTGDWQRQAEEEVGIKKTAFFQILKNLPPGKATKKGKKWVRLF